MTKKHIKIATMCLMLLVLLTSTYFTGVFYTTVMQDNEELKVKIADNKQYIEIQEQKQDKNEKLAKDIELNYNIYKKLEVEVAKYEELQKQK